MPKHLNRRLAAIKSNNAAEPGFHFQLAQPSGQLGAVVQGIWSAMVTQTEPVAKSLYSDAGSGIVFNLSGEVSVNGAPLPQGVVVLPVNKRAEHIELASGSCIAGIRFHPAISFGVLGQHVATPSLISPEQAQRFALLEVLTELQQTRDTAKHLRILESWAQAQFSIGEVLPDYLAVALRGLESDMSPGQLSANQPLSQRQLERVFKAWLEMTPKHYQRIMRIKKAALYLREHKHANLADVAAQFGFSDQAHMTREFRAIADTTPGKL